ncbi:putative serpin-Z5 [Miscanthus floridulus]|uniref:putative serpin-Z5 n=1 Tax=Miscanthus floridulus TaxID=154761 RepID=UPI0034577F24
MAKATRNLITEVLNPEDNNRNTVHVVANAIYFKGEWRDPFDKEDTVDREFHRLDGSSVEVPFLQSWSYQYIDCHSGFKVLKLPYEMMNESNWDWMLYHSLPKFCMCVFLPDDRKGLQGMVEEIASSPKFFHDHLPLKCVPVGQFRLPKFKLSFETRIVAEDLKHLGLHLPFDEAEANMTDMLLEEDERRVFVSHVIHKAVIEMTEAGSEAAAVTVECDDMGCSLYDDSPPPPKPVDFVAEHPFTFFIVEETSGAVVFSGHVLDPSKEE